MKKNLFLLLLLFPNLLISQIKSPEVFLGYPIGTQFTYHHKIVEYAKHLANSKPERVSWVSYGQTNEGRELGQLIITNQNNINRLQAIRQKHQDVLQGKINDRISLDELPLIINLSFNVHGNEASGSEASLSFLYDLVTNDSLFKTKTSFVILVDPCINPDGREAYVTQFKRRNYFASGNEDPFDQEHFEGNVSGRYNHYSFDLNRDWIWQTQVETKQRMEFFQSWLPMVHADFHEQSYQHSYYFPPAAKPYLNFISNSTKDLQESIGVSFARLFDSNNWNYFTREIYDLYYPGYGDTYPILNGALAMTLEQGGIRGGLTAEKSNGDTITLVERVKHHSALASNLVQWAILNQLKVKESFYSNQENFRKSPANQFKSYVIPNNQIEKSLPLIKLLQKNRIEIGSVGKDLIVKSAYSYKNEKAETIKISAKDLVISSFQSASPLVKILLDPVIELEDSLTYDITAWNLFNLHQINAYGLQEKLSPIDTFNQEDVSSAFSSSAVAYSLKPNQQPNQVEFLEKVIKAGFKVVFNDADLIINSKVLTKGHFFLLKLKKELSFEAVIQLANKFNIDLHSINSFKSDNAIDLGSKHLIHYQTPKIAVLVDPSFDTNQQGELAHYFTQKNQIKATFLPFNQLFQANLFNYSHIVFPSGKYKSFSQEEFILLNDWISKGGNAILMENAVQIFNQENYSKRFSMNFPKDTLILRDHYDQRTRNEISRGFSGNLVKVQAEVTNPLLFGLNENQIYLFNNNTEILKPGKNWQNLLQVENDVPYKGFLGSKNRDKLKNSIWMSYQEVAKGKLVWFGFNPLFRGIESESMKAFSNCFMYYNF